MEQYVLTSILCAWLLAMGASTALGQAQETPVPAVVTHLTRQKPDEMARLERPGTVFFADNCDSDSGFAAYLEVRGLQDGRASVATDPALVHTGLSAYQFIAPANDGRASGSGATLWFGPGGYDTVYFRRYIRFAPDYDQGNLNHTGGGLAAVAGSDPWAGMGQAGIRPTGADRFNASLEAWKDWGHYPAPGYFFIYTYWMDMVRDPDGNYWGNFFGPPEGERLVPERGRWYCLEQMIRANDPGRANGEMAAWIDGELHIHATGFRWRTTPEVQIKRAGFGIYIHQADRENRVWYDDVVLSTGYIGPLSETDSSARPTTWGQLKQE